MSNKVTISGNIAFTPEFVEGNTPRLSFPLYDNERRKNKDTQEYEDTGNVTKLRVTLWGEMAQEWNGKLGQGDVVEIECSITEREFEKSDGTKGRSLQTTFVNSLVVKFQKSGAAEQPAAQAQADGSGWGAPVGGGWS